MFKGINSGNGENWNDSSKLWKQSLLHSCDHLTSLFQWVFSVLLLPENDHMGVVPANHKSHKVITMLHSPSDFATGWHNLGQGFPKCAVRNLRASQHTHLYPKCHHLESHKFFWDLGVAILDLIRFWDPRWKWLDQPGRRSSVVTALRTIFGNHCLSVLQHTHINTTGCPWCICSLRHCHLGSLTKFNDIPSCTILLYLVRFRKMQDGGERLWVCHDTFTWVWEPLTTASKVKWAFFSTSQMEEMLPHWHQCDFSPCRPCHLPAHLPRAPWEEHALLKGPNKS